MKAAGPRAVGWAALAGVSAIAGTASYFHALSVIESTGARPPVSWLVPAVADLVILGASADLLAASRAGHPRPRLTMVALAAGVVVTLAMNVASGAGHGVGGRLVAGWPAVAFILALESLMAQVRRGGDAPGPAAAAASEPPPGAVAGAVPSSAAEAAETSLRATAAAGNPLSVNQLQERFSLTRAQATRMRRDVLAEVLAAQAAADSAELPAAAVPSLNGGGGHE